jgi:hypothetical protein
VIDTYLSYLARPRVAFVVALMTVVLAAATVAGTVALTSGRAPATAAQGPRHAAGVPAAPAVKTATVQQYASAVSPPFKALRESYAQYKTNACAVRSGSLSPACALVPHAFDLEAQTLVVALTAAAKEGAPAYIGQPPAEIKQLVGDTLYAARDLDDTIGPDGRYEAPILLVSISRLMTAVDQWDPYL